MSKVNVKTVKVGRTASLKSSRELLLNINQHCTPRVPDGVSCRLPPSTLVFSEGIISFTVTKYLMRCHSCELACV